MSLFNLFSKNSEDVKYKYVITFRKSLIQNKSSIAYYYAVKDSLITNTFNNISDRFDVEILYMEIGDCYSDSRIVFKCKKSYKYKIFNEFCSNLGSYIINSSIKATLF